MSFNLGGGVEYFLTRRDTLTAEALFPSARRHRHEREPHLHALVLVDLGRIQEILLDHGFESLESVSSGQAGRPFAMGAIPPC